METVVELAGHAVHDDEPTVSEYCPTSQLVHLLSDLVIVPKNPALHWQAMISDDPGSAVAELSGHFVHVS